MRRAFFALAILTLATTAWGEDIKIGVRPVAPYVMVDTKGAYSGLEYEIIAAALAVKGHTLKPTSYPLNRIIPSFKAGEVAAAAPVLPANDAGGFLSDVYLVYNNVAMSLSSSGFDFKTPTDLKGHAVIAFPNAKIVLGAEFAAALEGNPKYQEDPQQVTHIRLLFAKRTEVAIGEARILSYFIKSPETGVDVSIPVQMHRIFPPTSYRVAFATQALATDFNEGLKTIKANGTYDKLIAKYSK